MLAEIYEHMGHYEEEGSDKVYLNGEELWDEEVYKETLEFHAKVLQEESFLDLRLEYDMENWDEEDFEDFKESQKPCDDMGF